jgi:hypothetical protein
MTISFKWLEEYDKKIAGLKDTHATAESVVYPAENTPKTR